MNFQWRYKFQVSILRNSHVKVVSTLKLPQCPHRTDIKILSRKNLIYGLNKRSWEEKLSKSKIKDSVWGDVFIYLQKAKKQYFWKPCLEMKPLNTPFIYKIFPNAINIYELHANLDMSIKKINSFNSVFLLGSQKIIYV